MIRNRNRHLIKAYSMTWAQRLDLPPHRIRDRIAAATRVRVHPESREIFDLVNSRLGRLVNPCSSISLTAFSILIDSSRSALPGQLITRPGGRHPEPCQASYAVVLQLRHQHARRIRRCYLWLLLKSSSTWAQRAFRSRRSVLKRSCGDQLTWSGSS